MSEVGNKLENSRLSDTTKLGIQDRLSCVFNSIDLNIYLNDIKVQEGYDLLMKLAPNVGLQYQERGGASALVLVEGYEFCDISTIVLDYVIFCRDARELLQMNPALLTELTENGIVKISKSDSKWLTSKGLEIKVFPKGMISLLRYNIAFSDIVLYDDSVAKYFATIIQDGRSIRVVSRIDRMVSLKTFSKVEDIDLGLCDFMKESVKGYEKFIELSNGYFDSATVEALRGMSCDGISFKDKYKIIYLDLSTVNSSVRARKFVDLIFKSIDTDYIRDVYVVGGSSSCRYSVLTDGDRDTFVIY